MEIFHLDIPDKDIKDEQLQNIYFILVTWDVFHSAIPDIDFSDEQLINIAIILVIFKLLNNLFVSDKDNKDEQSLNI